MASCRYDPCGFFLGNAVTIQKSQRHLLLLGTRVCDGQACLGRYGIHEDPGLGRQRGRGHGRLGDQLPVLA